ncbi:tRNA (adenosine(37)-N6)-threonylcarbamoyltransferase complex dimerization subunit type 1 TsaB [bacterium]|nr:tRNA (adenosine(37)-N6)-threonylcarbamoyltransferase complex dimerization subunit type 1 TsaB [bacterium]
MLTLTLSTSSAQGSLCLGRDNAVLASEVWLKQTSHSEKITSSLDQLFKKSGATPQNLELIICSQGPGSFTGLRVGLSVARSLSYSFNVPIIALNDCLSIALNAPKSSPHILVTLDAQKNKIFAAIYFQKQNQLQEILAPCLISPEELSPFLSEKNYLILGDGLSLLSKLDDSIQKKLSISSSLSHFPNAEKMFFYAMENFSSLEQVSWKKLGPLYLRASAAEEVAAEKSGKIL